MKNILSHFSKNSCSSQRYFAFTLAEVLITLVIIGIVAALTIPTLVNKVQKHEYVVGLKKEYAMLNNGFAKILSDDGVNKLDDTSAFQSMTGVQCNVSNANADSCKSLIDSLNKYFRFSVVESPIYITYFLNGHVNFGYNGKTLLVFSDGSVMIDGAFYKSASKLSSTKSAQIAAAGGHLYSLQGWFFIDVNGFKKPNTYGRDVFEFWLSGDGKWYPQNGKDVSLYFGTKTWQSNAPVDCGTPDSAEVSQSDGYGCSARIMEEGWEMNY